MMTIKISTKKNKLSKGFIVIGSDHAGLMLKEKIKDFLIRKKMNIADVGIYSKEPVDYPDIAKRVGIIVKRKKSARGILICGSGTGMCIAANRMKGIRAAAAYDQYTAKMSRKDNDSNVLCLRARGTKAEKELRIVDIWLRTKFSGCKRHVKRIKKLDMVR